MPTGACGIDCDVCKLNTLGICSTCGSGVSREGLKKLEAQKRILGRPCPILACAIERHVGYCTNDCDGFPCDSFRAGPYPFGHGFLDMQERRRGKNAAATTASVPVQHWEGLEKREPAKLSKRAQVKDYPPTGFLLPFLKEYLLVDRQNRCLYRQGPGRWEPIKNPLLELVSLVYLLNAGPEPLGNKTISVKELKSAHFFRGPHELRIGGVLERYGNDAEGFRRAAEGLGGEPLDLADVAYKFWAFPKVPLCYLLWKGDEEFPATLSVLFDRSIEHHLPPDAIWGLVSLVSDILIRPDSWLGRG